MEDEPKSPIDTDRTVLSSAANTEIGGRYRVVRWLGSGAMGAVHLAEDSKLHRQVAIKTVRAELSRTPEFRKRIERECVLHARVGPHPHIVTLFDKFEEGEQIHLVMEYVQGEPLQHILEQNMEQRVVLPPTTSLAVAAQCLEALFRIHAHGIVHRDIKPANIMVTVDDSGETCAKLMDFGIARLMEGDEQYATLTTVNGGGPGTPLYMAPEQIDSKTFGPISYATDIYAMGILLYQLFSGHPPFMGTVTELLNAHVNLRPPPLHSGAQWTVPRALEEIMNRALAKQPRDRFASAQDFRQQLIEISGALTQHPKLMADPVPATEQATRISSTGGSMGAAIGADVDNIPEDVDTASARVVLPPRQPKRGFSISWFAASATLVLVAVVAGAAAYWALGPRGTSSGTDIAAGNTGPDAAPAPMPVSMPSETPVTVSLDPAPQAGSPPPVAPDTGVAPHASSPGDKSDTPSVQITDIPNSPPDISMIDLGVGHLPGATPSADIPLVSAPVTAPSPEAPAKVEPATTGAPTPPAQDTAREYKVKPGDTLAGIADANKVDVKDLQWWNELKDPNNLLVEQTLRLYARPGLQPKDKFFASLPKPAPVPPPTTPKVTPSPEASQEPVAPPPETPAKQPPKKKSIKDVFKRIFH